MITFERKWLFEGREWKINSETGTHLLVHNIGPKRDYGSVEYRLFLYDNDSYHRIIADSDDMAFEKATNIIRKVEYLKAMRILEEIAQKHSIVERIKVKKVV